MFVDLEAVRKTEQEAACGLTGVQTDAGYMRKVGRFWIVMSTHPDRAQILLY